MIHIFINKQPKPGEKTVSLSYILRQLVVENDEDIRHDIDFSTSGDEMTDIPFYEPLLRQAVNTINDRIQRNKFERINIFGAEEGVILAVLLCQKLKHLQSHEVEINMCLFQPEIHFKFENTLNSSKFMI